MPRPIRKRTIYQKPRCCRFEPEDASSGTVQLTLDELEAVRLADDVQLDQAECAGRMNVSRSTFQNILGAAHQKIAQALVYGKTLCIGGGNVILEEDPGCGCCGGKSVNRTGSLADMKGKEKMKIAVTFDPASGEIFQHFGKTEWFKVYDIEDGRVVSSNVVSSNGQGHGALAGVLSGLGADALICGGIGMGAQNALKAMGIRFFGGCSGDADGAVNALLAGNLQYQEDAACDHHGEHHDGGCGHDGDSCC